MQLNKHQFIDLVKFFRNQKLIFYYNQSIDYNFSALVELYSKAYRSISTSPDGNCLFNAVSINLFGNEIHSFNIKLVSAFILFEYEHFFRFYLERFGFHFNFESLILNTIKFGVWGSTIHYLAFSLLLCRPIYSFELSQSIVANPCNFLVSPIVFFFQNSHFVAGLRMNSVAQVTIPRTNLTRFVPNDLLPLFLNY